MSASGYLFFALLSIFLNHIPEASSAFTFYLDEVQYPKRFKSEFTITTFRWLASLNLTDHYEGPRTAYVFNENINSSKSYYSPYSIIADSKYRNFTVNNATGITVRATDQFKPRCHFDHTYRTDNITFGLDTREGLTDRWYMRPTGTTKKAKELEKDDDLALVYFRASRTNLGSIRWAKRDGDESFLVARFEKFTSAPPPKKPQDPSASPKIIRKKGHDHRYTDEVEYELPPDHPLRGKTYIKLSLDLEQYEPYYIMGLWTMVNFRISRCGI